MTEERELMLKKEFVGNVKKVITHYENASFSVDEAIIRIIELVMNNVEKKG